MNRIPENLRKDFQGGAEALIAAAQELAKKLNLSQETAEGNERLLRHYVSVGVVDKPMRDGRDANYGYRHLAQFVAARRLLAEGFQLAKIAKYTAVVPTDDLSRYLEKTDPTSEAELLVAAFRAETPERPTNKPQSTRRPSAPKSLPNAAAGIGMVDVMHEMRAMEQRVHEQLKDMQDRVHQMVGDAITHLSVSSGMPPVAPAEFKAAVTELAKLLDGTTTRFESLLQKPTAMIEKQIEQQRFMFEEAHRQKDFLERMFSELLQEQRKELARLFERQARVFNDVADKQEDTTRFLFDRLTDIETKLDECNQLHAVQTINKP